MDEIFHVRQTLKYIQGDWKSWDNKITTPPGLYVAFVFAHKLMGLLGALPTELIAMHFRLISVFFSTLNYVVILKLIRIMKCDAPNILAMAVVSQPLLIFFSAFYYTDHCSILFVMTSVYFSLLRHNWLSALFVSYSVFTRQSNILWVPLLMCIHSSKMVSQDIFGNDRCSSIIWIRRLLCRIALHPFSFVHVTLKCVFELCLPFVLVLVAFMCFVITNKGIVLGDREAHTAVLNIPQFFYFVTFCALSTPFHFVGFIFMDCYELNKDFLKKFNDWLNQSPSGYSTINPGRSLLTISTNLQCGQRGLVACYEIKPKQCCYSIPLNDIRLILTPERCTFLLNKCHECFNHFKQIKITLSSFDILTAFIYHCKISTNCLLKHIWTPYLSVLPNIYLDPLSCILMHNENLFQIIFNDHINYFQSYDVNIKLKRLLLRLLTSWHHVKSLFIDNDHIDNVHYNGYCIPPKDYLWAWFTVNSRCVSCPFKESLTVVQQLCQNLFNSDFNIKQFIVNHDIIYHIIDNTLLNNKYTIALIPFFDFFNHKQNISTNLSMSADRKSLELYLDYSVSINEQVFINYGAHDNLTLYTEYGFSLPFNENPNEVIYLSYYFLIDLFHNFNNPLTLTTSAIIDNQYTTYYENYSLQDYFHQILNKLNLSHSQCSLMNNDIIWSSVYLSVDNNNNSNNNDYYYYHSPSYYLALILYLMYTFIQNKCNHNNSHNYTIIDNLYEISEDLIYSTIQLVLNRIYAIL
ncbi:hypothetical protein MN116_007593 [Schistosoma mekongi]|uniref:Dol-P-Glc:Glc(2)Man(9)GlcNAc(2)-PP-Dol alpha-1,2-glucosyltransferase n=1 Tax=Schistosoma mekongi TaxID=38744 RepID=A0AAE2D2N3_SCHME|nr:hypothetical protein MN116_007593 [Schistosoma mekongi]